MAQPLRHLRHDGRRRTLPSKLRIRQSGVQRRRGTSDDSRVRQSALVQQGERDHADGVRVWWGDDLPGVHGRDEEADGFLEGYGKNLIFSDRDIFTDFLFCL